MWYAWDKSHLIYNVRFVSCLLCASVERFVVWGLTIRGYPSHWWKGMFFSLFASIFALENVFTQTDVLMWIEEA